MKSSTGSIYKRVLVVDDSEFEAYVTKLVICNSLFAEEVTLFNSAKKALAYLQSTPTFPDAIFLDINMPVMDGFGFLDNYLQFPEELRSHCCIIMISGTHSPKDFKRLKDYPVIRKFIGKPLTVSVLDELRNPEVISSSIGASKSYS